MFAAVNFVLGFEEIRKSRDDDVEFQSKAASR
jgi:hypothetical protein